MSQNDFIIPNQSGLSFRQDVENAVQSLASISSGANEPSTTYNYQLWADTTAGLLKQRIGAAWVTIGTLGSANWGLAKLASPSFTGTATFAGDVNLTGTGAIDIPAGTTAQRPGTPSSGMIRFNTTLGQYEGHNGTAWTSIGGGATGGGSDAVFIENGQTVTTNYTITTSKNAVSAGPVTINAGVTVTVPSGQSWVIV